MDAEYDRLESEPGQKENPKKNANIFSILSFWWVGELLGIGNKRPLENEDLFPLLDEDKTQTSTEKLQRTWNEGKASCSSNKGGNGYRLLKALIRAFPYTDYMVILGMTLLGGICNVLQPVFLSLLLLELMTSSGEESWWAYIYAAGICLSSFVRAITTHQWNYQAKLMALRWKSATIGIIYKKALKDAKHIVVMKEGSILAKGDFSLLLTSGVDLNGIDKHAVRTVTVQTEKSLIEDRVVNEGNPEEEFKRLEIAEEDRVIGYISWKMYWHYMQAGMCTIVAVAMDHSYSLIGGFFI
ncbi:hypothetical protein OS493_028373 [Desmophyllum pertusum]|uniref:ABC transmembrane type-1 domain-containing protein n=1 Tax=Desmophyllum pertusum TaxID=174260 RepID=A0A9X0D7R3_9CNID|nr:hypothetical protein OS493_028373 [Desmophyllum pertusum]